MRGTLSISWVVRDIASTFRIASRSSGQGSVVVLHVYIPVNGWSSVLTILVFKVFMVHFGFSGLWFLALS